MQRTPKLLRYLVKKLYMNLQTVVTITPTQVVLQRINLDRDTEIVLQKVIQWQKGKLAEAIAIALQEIPETKRIRILLTESLYYVVGFSVEKKLARDRDYIREKASEVLIEDLETVRWDYATAYTTLELAYVQVICLTKAIDEELSELTKNLGVIVDAIVPESLVLLESFLEKNESFILIYSDEYIKTISVVKDGLVLISTGFTQPQVVDRFLQTVQYAQNHLQFSADTVVVSGVKDSELSEVKKNFKIVRAQLHVTTIFAELNAYRGRDEKVLSIRLDQGAGFAGFQENKSGMQIFLGIIFFVALVGIIFGIVVAGNLF